MLILKGIIIGIGKIIPGVSGSMLAISMGIYQRLINCINNILKLSKKDITFIFKISIGIIISIVFFSNIILDCLNNYYLITMLFFIGLIIGSMDDIKKEIKKNNNYITVIVFIITIIFSIININNNINIINPIFNSIYFIFIGFVDAVTMVIPGISGTATLMMLGAYNKVITMFSNLLNINLFYDNIKVLIPFSIGLVLGIFITAKIINYLFKYYKSKTYSAILGFSISTIFIMIIKSIKSFYTIIDLIIGIIMLGIGIYISKKINHLKND